MTNAPEQTDLISLARPVALLRKMNHDLRNPLNAVMATANMLEEGVYDPLTPGQKRAVQRIERNSERILALLDDLLAYAKAEVGEYPLVPADFDPRGLIETIRVTCQPMAATKDLSFTIATTDSLPKTLRGDQAVIRRIVLALTWNAISFTSQGGITLESAWTGEWQIKVRDTGPGIPNAGVPRLFEALWRGDTVGSAVPTSGTGLGLAAARSLAKLMQGDITLEQTTSEGSIFVLHVPCV